MHREYPGIHYGRDYVISSNPQTIYLSKVIPTVKSSLGVATDKYFIALDDIEVFDADLGITVESVLAEWNLLEIDLIKDSDVLRSILCRKY